VRPAINDECFALIDRQLHEKDEAAEDHAIPNRTGDLKGIKWRLMENFLSSLPSIPGIKSAAFCIQGEIG